MWRDIAIANRPALLQSIDLFSAQLEELRKAIEAGEGDTLLQTFSRAKAARDEFAALLAARGQTAT
jgi:prephenate dehydrogenase